jgi:hypothetical protein
MGWKFVQIWNNFKIVKKMRYIGNTLDLAKLKEFAKIQG